MLTPTPHLHPLPFSRGEAIRPPGRRRACPTTFFDRVLLRHTNYSYVALSPRRAGSGRDPPRRFPALKLGRYPHSLAALPSILEIPFLNSWLPDSFTARIAAMNRAFSAVGPWVRETWGVVSGYD